MDERCEGATRRCGTEALAMKWRETIAQGFSPGFAWQRFDLKVSTDDAATSRWNRINSAFWQLDDPMKPKLHRSPLQGVRSKKTYPGLKPWAMVYRRSAAGRPNPPITNHLSLITSHFSLLTFE